MNENVAKSFANIVTFVTYIDFYMEFGFGWLILVT